jgi:ABC-type transporter Mla subunit MlaD
VEQDFLRGTGRRQQRALHIVAIAVIVTVAVVALAITAIYRHSQGHGSLPLSMDLPYVAPGVATGTKVILRGAEVGEVVGLEKISDGSVRMGLSLNTSDIDGLTDAFDVDFRPANYFGVTGVNVIGRPGGSQLVAGQTLNRIPLGDFTMSTMIEKGSLVINGTLTNDMISTLDKVIRYTNGLNPMIQSGIVFADTIAKTQRALPSTLFNDANAVLDVLPAFDRETVDALYGIFDTKFNRLPDGSRGVDDQFLDDTGAGLELGSGSLFSAAGHLLASHPAELAPATEAVKTLSDAVPDLLDQGALTGKLGTVVERYDRAMTGPDGAKTLNLRIELENLPMLATPLALSGLGPEPRQEGPR